MNGQLRFVWSLLVGGATTILAPYSGFTQSSQSLTASGESEGKVRVEGKVSLNGAPWRDAVVRLSDQAETRVSSATTSSSGNIALTVGLPGSYFIEVRDKRTPFVWTKRLDLVEPMNTIALEFTADVLVVNVVSPGGARFLVLRSDELVLKTRFPQVGSAEPLELPVPVGEYRLSAEAGDVLTSGIETVVASDTGRRHNVDLFLATNDGLAFVTGVSDLPVPDTVVQTSGRIARRLQPGAFSLAGFPMGSQVVVSARGYVPTCVVLNNARDLHIALRSGFRAEFRIDALLPERPRGAVEGLPGSECPVPFEVFTFQKLSTATAGETRFQIANFPQDSVVKWRRSPDTVSVLASGKVSSQH